MGYGQHLIPLGYLEVPLPPACSLVWRALWNRPAPFWLTKKSVSQQGLDVYASADFVLLIYFNSAGSYIGHNLSEHFHFLATDTQS